MKSTLPKITCYGVTFWVIQALQPAVAESAAEALSVTTIPLSSRVIATKSSAPASVISTNNSPVSAEINGKVTRLHADAGDRVKEGQTLLSIDCRDYQYARDQAKAALAVAQEQYQLNLKRFQRNNSLLKSNTISQNMVDESLSLKNTSQADINAKRAQLASARLAVEKCTLTAPFSGQVVSRFATLGQFLTVGTPAWQIIHSDSLEITAELTPSDIRDLQQSGQLQFRHNDQVVNVGVRAIIDNINPATRTQQVRLRATSSNHNLVNGLSGRLHWQGSQQRISADYIVRRNGQLGIMVVKDDKAHFHPLDNAREGQNVAVKLPGNTLLIEQNRHVARDGQSIKIQ